MTATSTPVKFEDITAYKNEEEGGRDAACGCRDSGNVEGELVWGRDHVDLVCRTLPQWRERSLIDGACEPTSIAVGEFPRIERNWVA
jgi:hypothetical protein